MLGRLDSLAAALLAEDAGGGDLTTETLGIGAKRARLAFHARGAYVAAGLELAERMLAQAGLETTRERASGERVANGDPLLSGSGDAAAAHAAWKSAQTLIEALSGIATSARAIVDAAKAVEPDVQVACTRKTFPGGRALCHLAVKAGGAILHRAGLAETLLVFAEHRAFLGDEPLEAVALRLRRAAPEKRLAIEVGDANEAARAIEAGFEVIQLEKFPPDQVAVVAALARGKPQPPLIAAAGGVNAGNAADYVRAGAGLLVTSAPYAAPPREVQTRLTALD